MSPTHAFVSHARNREDVVLWRALGQVRAGRYVEVSAAPGTPESVGQGFAERGWAGVRVDVSTMVGEAGRPLTSAALEGALQQQGCSAEDDVHFLAVTAEASTRSVLPSLDLGRRRPWVLVLEAVDPASGSPTHEAWEAEVMAADYQFCLFDGVSRFYVAAEHAPRLREALSYPACVLDDFVSQAHLAALERNDGLLAQTTHWRTVALTQWADAMATVLDQDEDAGRELRRERDHLLDEILAYRQTLSWRVTRPLRAVRPLLARVRAR